MKKTELIINEEIISIIAGELPPGATTRDTEVAEKVLSASRLLNKTMNKSTALKLFMREHDCTQTTAARYIQAAEAYLGEMAPVKKNAMREMLKNKHIGMYNECLRKYKSTSQAKYLELAQKALEAIAKIYDLKVTEKKPQEENTLTLPTITLSTNPELLNLGNIPQPETEETDGT
jgi:hypothetical protein